MIGITVLAVAAAWFLLSMKLARYVVARLRSRVLSALFGTLTFAIIILLPFMDELIGRWQFKQLCDAEAIAFVSPEVQKVVAAKKIHEDRFRDEFVFPVSEQASKYVDLGSGEVFYSYKAFHTPGGFLLRAGLGLGNSTSCWPSKWMSRDFGFDINVLLSRGKQ